MENVFWIENGDKKNLAEYPTFRALKNERLGVYDVKIKKDIYWKKITSN